jgi:uncharacterized protein with von Willebrand factor type A (vWA) domain
MDADGAAPARPARKGMLRGVDRAAFAVALSHRLRRAGMTVDLTAAATVVAAFALAMPRNRSELYWTCRIALVRRHDELSIFDRVFAAVFADAVLDMDPHARRRPLPSPPARPDDVYRGLPHGAAAEGSSTDLPWATLPAVVGPAGESEDDAPAVPLRLPTDARHLADVPFDAFDARDLEVLQQALTRLAERWPRRRSRRTVVGRSGRTVGLRATMARSRSTGFEPATLMELRPRYRPRRVVMICDVSASMQAHATAYLHLMRALVRTTDAEVFAFATGLTRLTVALSRRSPTDAVAAATAAVADRFGGTRIGSNLAALLSGRYRDLVRGAIVLIGSDGWDADDADLLARAMQRLRRRAHRVLWIIPRASAPEFQPTVAGMAAALPYCDRLLAGATMADLMRAVAVVCRETTDSAAHPSANETDGAARGLAWINSTG